MFNFYRTFIYIFIVVSLVISSVYGEDAKLNKIEVIVNEQAITNYDVIQRLKINAILRQIEINNANYEVFINTVVDELISEILKMEKILEYNINVAEEELKDHENRLLNNLSFNKDQFKNILSENAVNYENFISYVETDLKWQKLIYGLYFRMTSITEIEIKELRNKTPELTNEIAKEIIIQKQLDLKSDKLIQDMKNEATIEFRS